jgi:uracil-DNA glycosylase family 4
MKIGLLPLHELYAKPKITPSVEAAIASKEDFSSIAPTYCEKVCRLKCKNPRRVQLLTEEVDILIIQDHRAVKGKFDKTEDGQEKTQKAVIEFIAKKAGFAGLSYRITNLLKCAPTEEDFPKGKPPTETVLKKCRPYLLEEIRRTKPKVIISLSTAVTKAIGLKKHSNNGNRGEIVNGNIVITLHPRVLSMIRQNARGAMWSADYFQVILRDFQKAARIARGELVVPDMMGAIEFNARGRIHIVRTLDGVMHVRRTMENLPQGAIWSFDTETTGLDGLHPDAKILCIQFGWRDPETRNIVAAVIPLWHRENRFLDPDMAWKILAPLLVNNQPKVAHNGKFDILYIAQTTGVRVRNLAFDTMLMLHSLDSGAQGTFSLKVAAWDFLSELGFAGYESLLPKLTKTKAQAASGPDEDVIEEETVPELVEELY